MKYKFRYTRHITTKNADTKGCSVITTILKRKSKIKIAFDFSINLGLFLYLKNMNPNDIAIIIEKK